MLQLSATECFPNEKENYPRREKYRYNNFNILKSKVSGTMKNVITQNVIKIIIYILDLLYL